MTPRIIAIALACVLFGIIGAFVFFLGTTTGGAIFAATGETEISPYFSMNESSANEMSMDGGTPLAAPGEDAAVNMASTPDNNSPAVEVDQ